MNSEEMKMTPLPSRARRSMPLVGLLFALDVDAERRLVEEEDLGPVLEPLAENHLLLVAARESCRIGCSTLELLIASEST